jgi:hypothetical protein
MHKMMWRTSWLAGEVEVRLLLLLFWRGERRGGAAPPLAEEEGEEPSLNYVVYCLRLLPALFDSMCHYCGGTRLAAWFWAFWSDRLSNMFFTFNPTSFQSRMNFFHSSFSFDNFLKLCCCHSSTIYVAHANSVRRRSKHTLNKLEQAIAFPKCSPLMVLFMRKQKVIRCFHSLS